MLAGVNPLPIKEDFDARLDLLCENINKDYVNWSNGRASLGDLKGMIRIKPGRKFIKIIRENSVWGFVGKPMVYIKVFLIRLEMCLRPLVGVHQLNT